MIKNKIYVNSIGIDIEITCRDYAYNLIDLSLATELILLIQKPDGEELELTATYTGDNNEILKYVTAAGDLDVTGKYIVQGKVVTPSYTIFSEPVQFRVYDLFTAEDYT